MMPDPDDYPEERPYGEHSPEADHRLTDDPHREAVGEEGHYAGGPVGVQPTCESCGAPLPEDHDSTRCKECLKVGAEPLDAGVDLSSNATPDWQIQQVLFAIVPGSSRYLAAAKGSAALTRSSNRHDALDRAKPIYEAVDGIPEIFQEQFGDLPELVRLDSEQGQQLVEIARATAATTPDRSQDYGETPINADGIPQFVDAAGRRINADADLEEQARLGADDVLNDGDAPCWLMPAWGLTRSEDPIVVATKCLRCERFTDHAFLGDLQPPTDSDYTTMGIWECQQCERRTFWVDQEMAVLMADSDSARDKRLKRMYDRQPSAEKLQMMGDVRAGEFSPPDAGGATDE